MARPAPDPEWCARAWELHAQGYPYRHIAELLRAEFPEIKTLSHETARQWAKTGRATHALAELLDTGEERQRSAERLGLWAAALLEEARVNPDVSILDVMPHLRWIHRERSVLTGTDAPKRVALQDDRTAPPEVDPDTAATVEAAQVRAAAEERALNQLSGEES